MLFAHGVVVTIETLAKTVEQAYNSLVRNRSRESCGVHSVGFELGVMVPMCHLVTQEAETGELPGVLG